MESISKFSWKAEKWKCNYVEQKMIGDINMIMAEETLLAFTWLYY